MTPASSEPEEVDLADIDRHFGAFIARFGGNQSRVQPVAALLSRAVRQGHVCLDLNQEEVAKTGWVREKWRKELTQSSAFGAPQDETPIVIAGERLFLRRYWEYQQLVAKNVWNRASRNKGQPKEFGTQEAAIEASLKNWFTIISGGPGTGKTWTVLNIVRRFIEENIETRARVALAAPTGKAAARIQELLQKAVSDSPMSPTIRQHFPQSASTIHRLLGYKPDSVFFRHDRNNPLPLDLLVVDEASMVDLPLMAKLFDALPEHARIILLGDRDQLASVAPGSVLADLADAAAAPKSRLRNALFVLTKNYRFGNENAIYRLSSAVRTGDANSALEILGQRCDELGSRPLPASAQLSGQLEALLVERYRRYCTEKNPEKALNEFGRFKIVCAVRQGPFGVEKVNSLIEDILYQRGLIPDPSRPYPSKPILITKNDYQTRLFNGDIGVILPDPNDSESDQLWAWFIGAEGSLRRLSVGRLPEHELAYAMTVHKAQGSQFEEVLFVLPDRDSPVLTRELVYTGVTRASKGVEVWYKEEILRASVERKAVRHSGLREALQSA